MLTNNNKSTNNIQQFSTNKSYQSLACLSDIFFLMNSTNRSMQGHLRNIINMHGSLKTFIHKLTNINGSVQINKYEAFPNF